jgi:hypothetical protein
MPKVAGSCIALIFGLTATAGTQNVPGNPSRPGMPVKNAEIAVSDDVTAVGCLSKDSSTGRFLLNDAAVEVTPYMSSNATKANGPTGGSQTSKPFASKTSFTLKFNGLDQHVGHTIEVTGKLDPATANVDPTPDTIGGRGGNVSAAGDAVKTVPRYVRPNMNVALLKMIATSCSPTR